MNNVGVRLFRIWIFEILIWTLTQTTLRAQQGDSISRGDAVDFIKSVYQQYQNKQTPNNYGSGWNDSVNVVIIDCKLEILEYGHFRSNSVGGDLNNLSVFKIDLSNIHLTNSSGSDADWTITANFLGAVSWQYFYKTRGSKKKYKTSPESVVQMPDLNISAKIVDNDERAFQNKYFLRVKTAYDFLIKSCKVKTKMGDKF